MLSKKDKLIEFKLKIEELEDDKFTFKPFNYMDILKITTTEIRHSNILAWLLDPSANHELGDVFLSRFFGLVGVQFDENDPLLSRKFKSFRVQREFNNIDILVISKEVKFVLIIENKIWSGELRGQLNKYRSIISSKYQGYEKKYVYLNPYGNNPSDTLNWSSCSYVDVLRLLESIYSSTDIKNPEVKIFIKHYIDNIRRTFMGTEELKKLCTEIYKEHKEAIDLIIKYIPNTKETIRQVVTDDLSQRENVIIDKSDLNYIRFTTETIDRIIPRIGNDKVFTKENRVFLFEFTQDFRHGRLTIETVFGPSQNPRRIQLIDSLIRIADGSIIGNPKYDPLGKYIHLNSFHLLDVNTDEYVDTAIIADQIHSLLDNYFESYVSKFEELLNHI